VPGFLYLNYEISTVIIGAAQKTEKHSLFCTKIYQSESRTKGIVEREKRNCYIDKDENFNTIHQEVT